MSKENPKMFISYSWTNDNHEQWVIDLATELRENGINVILDKWDLKEGHDSYVFMEKMVSDPDVEKVILICDEEYAEKANNREGGVGTETQIITPELYTKQEQDKFVAIVKERDSEGEPYLPTFYKSRIYIDLSTEEEYGNNFERLLRWTYGQPLNKKPGLGKKPAYLTDEKHIQLGTKSRHRRAINAIKNGKSYWAGALSEFYSVFAENLERFRMDTEGDEIDVIVIKNIEDFIPYRNDLIQLFLVLGTYLKDNEEAYKLTHDFFENILPYTQKIDNSGSWKEWDFDNYKFIVHELFLYANACLINEQAFKFVNYLLSQRYYFNNKYYGNSDLYHFNVFRPYLKSLEYRNNRKNANRISIHADLLKSRCEGSGISFNKLMETDFILFLRTASDARTTESRLIWYPITLLFANRGYHPTFELFSRSKSQSFFDSFKKVLALKNTDELSELIELINIKKIDRPSFGGWPLNVSRLSNFEEIATLN